MKTASLPNFLISLSFTLCAGITMSPAIAQPAAGSPQPQPLILWDDRPAGNWMTEAYPIGNGRLGGMAFSDPFHEHIVLNEQSLWTGDEKETGAYQALGDLFIDLDGDQPVSGYRRLLDLDSALLRTSYTRDNIPYQQEYFCSFPDKVMALRFTAGKKGAYSGAIRLKDAHNARTIAGGNYLEMTGQLNNGLKYQARMMVKSLGGKVTTVQDSTGGWEIRLKKADSFTILLVAATDFSNRRSDGWRGEDPVVTNRRTLAAASAKSYAQLLVTHIRDYRALFARSQLCLGPVDTAKSNTVTRERILRHRENNDAQLEALLYQYGRYLLISSSRKGGLPANLQGLWNASNDPPWKCDYHSNINVEMNYWPAEPAGLSECMIPFLDYINSIRPVAKEHTQQEFPGARGWTVRTENNIFGAGSFRWNTPGSAWYMQALWDHFAFTQDTAYLRHFAYPIIKEVVEFWDDHLKRRPDGVLVSPMGWSPEHGPTEDGVTFDQELVYDLFTNYVRAAGLLGVDKAYRDHVQHMRDHLLMPAIGRWGQLQEWETDRDDSSDRHRHSSNLFGLYPGKRISPVSTPALAQAAKVSLTARGDLSTGWSMAWKINFWARLLDGEHAHHILSNFITLAGSAGVDYDNGGGVYANLLCAHPPFQIDGNLGYTAAIVEMLVQSQDSLIQVLPALPAAWSEGKLRGVHARGGFEITGLSWKHGRVVDLSIRSLAGGECHVLSPSPLTGLSVRPKTAAGPYGTTYRFMTQPGHVYRFIASQK